MNKNPRYSIVVPCYNEGEGLIELVKKCDALAKISNGEFIFVDNGSTDNTKKILEEIIDSTSHIKLVFVPKNKGYGYGILQGLSASSGQIIGWTHADLQTDPSDVLRAVDKFNSYEKIFVKGRRFARPVIDKFFTIAMSCFESLILRGIYRDINGQPTVFNASLLATWDDPPGDFSLDLYAYVSAKRQGYKIRRIPVIFGPRMFGNSSWNTGLYSRLNLIKRTLKFSIKLRKIF